MCFHLSSHASPQITSYSKTVDWKPFLYDLKQDKATSSHQCIQHSTKSPTYSNWAKKEKKRRQNGKEEVKFPVCFSHIYQNPKISINKLLKVISEFSKITGYTINIHKSAPLLYINNKITGKEINKTIP